MPLHCTGIWTNIYFLLIFHWVQICLLLSYCYLIFFKKVFFLYTYSLSVNLIEIFVKVNTQFCNFKVGGELPDVSFLVRDIRTSEFGPSPTGAGSNIKVKLLNSRFVTVTVTVTYRSLTLVLMGGCWIYPPSDYKSKFLDSFCMVKYSQFS